MVNAEIARTLRNSSAHDSESRGTLHLAEGYDRPDESLAREGSDDRERNEERDQSLEQVPHGDKRPLAERY